jgi:hypothetical protein
MKWTGGRTRWLRPPRWIDAAAGGGGAAWPPTPRRKAEAERGRALFSLPKLQKPIQLSQPLVHPSLLLTTMAHETGTQIGSPRPRERASKKKKKSNGKCTRAGARESKQTSDGCSAALRLQTRSAARPPSSSPSPSPSPPLSSL